MQMKGQSPTRCEVLTMPQSSALLPIPGLGHQDAAVVQSLLEGAGLFFELHHGFGECPDVILIRATDLPAVKALLLEYTIRSPRDEKIPIPW
jgi:hypothetical protein